MRGLSKLSVDEIKKGFLKYFDKVSFTKDDIDVILQLLKYDKKNSYGNVNFVLLQEIGNAVTDIRIPEELFQKAFAYYME